MTEKCIYVFLDESGDLNFSAKGSKFFMYTAVVMQKPFDGLYSAIENYKCKVMEFAIDNQIKKAKLHYFHAFDDNKYIRSGVYRLITEHLSNLSAYCIKVEKAKTHPLLQNDVKFYNKFLPMLIKYIAKTYSGYDRMIVITDTPPVRQDKEIITKAVKETISSISKVKYAFHQHPSCSHIGLQIADYISYAIHEKLNRDKLENYDLIRDCIKSEFDVFKNGNEYYY